jgi:phenylalanyl-tRNA synthetase beta chain
VRVPLSWLREFVDVDQTPEQLADRLTLLGMEVSAIERIGGDWHGIVVGELLEVGPHPGSSRLSLTRVRVGHAEPELSIVCGATNIRAGQRVPVALPGAVLPGDRRIEVSSIMASGARACSAAVTSWRSATTLRASSSCPTTRSRGWTWPSWPVTWCSTWT